MDKVTHYTYCDFPGYSKCGNYILWLYFLYFKFGFILINNNSWSAHTVHTYYLITRTNINLIFELCKLITGKQIGTPQLPKAQIFISPMEKIYCDYFSCDFFCYLSCDFLSCDFFSVYHLCIVYIISHLLEEMYENQISVAFCFIITIYFKFGFILINNNIWSAHTVHTYYLITRTNINLIFELCKLITGNVCVIFTHFRRSFGTSYPYTPKVTKIKDRLDMIFSRFPSVNKYFFSKQSK
jgi:hypothetical protein